VTRAVGTSDYVRGGAGVFLVDPGDIEGYRRSIEAALSLPRASGDMSQRVPGYEGFDDRLRSVCADVLGSRP
jgi:hypothetical protein